MFRDTHSMMNALGKFERLLGEVAAATALFTGAYVLLMVV